MINLTNSKEIADWIIQEHLIHKRKINDSIIYLMGGHFMPALDYEKNEAYPSIGDLASNNAKKYMKISRMDRFSTGSFEIVCEVTSLLKEKGLQVKICIIANDRTGLTKLRNSDSNKKDKKIIADYKKTLLKDFYSDQYLPSVYLKTLQKFNLSLNDVVPDYTTEKSSTNKKRKHLIRPIYCFRENKLHENFRKLVRNNKDVFKNKIEYIYQEKNGQTIDEFEIILPCLETPKIQYCAVTEDIYVGGNHCSIEIAEFTLRLLGGDGELSNCNAIPKRYKSIPKYKNSLLISFIPQACDKAVERGYQLYNKLFLPMNRNIKLAHIEMNTNPKKQLELMGVTIKVVSS